jgi:hypothetical protein
MSGPFLVRAWVPGGTIPRGEGERAANLGGASSGDGNRLATGRFEQKLDAAVGGGSHLLDVAAVHEVLTVNPEKPLSGQLLLEGIEPPLRYP